MKPDAEDVEMITLDHILKQMRDMKSQKSLKDEIKSKINVNLLDAKTHIMQIDDLKSEDFE